MAAPRNDGLKVIGKGSYGIVYKDSQRNVAIKRNIIDRDVSFSSCLREAELLTSLRGHPYIVELLSIESDPCEVSSLEFDKKFFQNMRDNSFHFIFELGQCTLLEALQNHKLRGGRSKEILHHILLGIDFLGKNKILHLDITSSNILIFTTSTGHVAKLCDFGISERHTSQERVVRDTTTHWYRAPEICLKSPYGSKADMWSYGCVLYEVVTGSPFINIESTHNNHIIDSILRKVAVNDEDLGSIRRKTPRTQKTLEEVIKLNVDEVKKYNSFPGGTYEQYLDLLEKILRFSPDKRISSAKALTHPFFDMHRDVIEETQSKFTTLKSEIPIIPAKKSIREKIAVSTFNIFSTRRSYTHKRWYTHRILFHAIRLCDVYCNSQEVVIEDVGLIFMVCLHIMIKYFSTVEAPPSFKELILPTYRDKIKQAEKIEETLVRDICEYKIYSNTVYEAADAISLKLTDNEVRDLLKIYVQGESFTGKTPTELLKNYLAAKDGKTTTGNKTSEVTTS